MLKSKKLPLGDEFLKLFIKYEIINWQAKHFWEKIILNRHFRSLENKKLMYVGLRVLLEYEYLKIDKSKSTKKAFSYNETPKLNELRNRYKKQKLENIFSEKKSFFLDEIRNKENNILFLDSLLLEDETLEKYLINYKEKLKIDIKNINSNIRLMNDILS